MRVHCYRLLLSACAAVAPERIRRLSVSLFTPVIRAHSATVCLSPPYVMHRLLLVSEALSDLVPHLQFSGEYPCARSTRIRHCLSGGHRPMSARKFSKAFQLSQISTACPPRAL